MSDNFCNVYKKTKSPIAVALDVILNVALVLIIALLCVVILYEPILVDGESMLPTINDGDRVAISRLDKDYKRGDIVVARKGEHYIIKRVVAVEGDVIAFAWVGGEVKTFINDMNAPVDEPYINEAMRNISSSHWKGVTIANSADDLISGEYGITVGENQLFLMGDNRNHSTDSRVDGVYEESSIKGKMAFNITESKAWSFIFDIIQTNKESTKND